jgi:hypothetical protein
MRRTISSQTTCTDRARSRWRCSSGDSGARGGPPDSAWKAGLVIVSPAEVVEVPLVERERAVVAQREQVVEDRVDVARLAVRGEPHHLVLARVDAEAGVVGERRVEQPERVGPALLAQRSSVAPRPTPIDAVAHSPDAVDGEHGRLLERRRDRTRSRRATRVLGVEHVALVGVVAGRAARPARGARRGR